MTGREIIVEIQLGTTGYFKSFHPTIFSVMFRILTQGNRLSFLSYVEVAFLGVFSVSRMRIAHPTLSILGGFRSISLLSGAWGGDSWDS